MVQRSRSGRARPPFQHGSASRPAPRPTGGRAPPDSEVVFGLRASLAVFARRRDDLVSVAFSREVSREVGELARWAASRGMPCRETSDGDLERLAGLPQHEGLCVVARPRRWLSTADLGDLLTASRGAAIALDRVRNPYNVGAVLRSAAFFGVDAALLGTPAPHPGLPPTAVRVAEGGAEHVPLARTTDLADTLARLRARGVRVVGADGRATASVFGFAFARPVVLVMGHEREGLGDRVRAQCDAVVAIPGRGTVESLNVGVAAGILVAELTRGRT